VDVEAAAGAVAYGVGEGSVGGALGGWGRIDEGFSVGTCGVLLSGSRG
jgi:hypothetical protein